MFILGTVGNSGIIFDNDDSKSATFDCNEFNNAVASAPCEAISWSLSARASVRVLFNNSFAPSKSAVVKSAIMLFFSTYML